MSTDPTPQAILGLPLDPGDVTGDYSTVRSYLQRVPRPPASDEWRWPLYVALVDASLIPGVTVGQDGTFESFPEAAQAEADRLIDAAVKALEACGSTVAAAAPAVTSPAPAPARPPAASTEPPAPVSEAAVQAALDAVAPFWREAHAILQAYPSAALARAMLEGAAPLIRAAERARIRRGVLARELILQHPEDGDRVAVLTLDLEQIIGAEDGSDG